MLNESTDNFINSMKPATEKTLQSIDDTLKRIANILEKQHEVSHLQRITEYSEGDLCQQKSDIRGILINLSKSGLHTQAAGYSGDRMVPEEVKKCIREIYDAFRRESNTYEDLKVKVERYIYCSAYNDEPWAAIAKRELEVMLSKELGSLLLNKLPEI